MRKIRKFAAMAAVMLAAALLAVCGCSCTGYDGDTVESDGITYYISESGWNAFARTYKWNLDPDNTDIYIPDRVDGATVEKVGGFMGVGVPCPFEIDADRDCVRELTLEPEKYGVPVTWRDVVFTVHLGKYVSDVYPMVEMGYMGTENEDGGMDFYRPVFRFECDPESPYMYSVGGTLYRRRDDTLVIEPEYLPREKGSGSYVPGVSGSDVVSGGDTVTAGDTSGAASSSD